MTHPAFRPLYAAIALTVVVLSFFDLFDRVVEGGFVRTYGSLYDMAGRGYGAPAVLGLVLLYVLALVLLALALFGLRGGAGQAAVIAISVLAVLMLVTKPGTTDPQPRLATGGIVMLVFAVILVVVASIDLCLIFRRNSHA